MNLVSSIHVGDFTTFNDLSLCSLCCPEMAWKSEVHLSLLPVAETTSRPGTRSGGDWGTWLSAVLRQQLFSPCRVIRAPNWDPYVKMCVASQLAGPSPHWHVRNSLTILKLEVASAANSSRKYLLDGEGEIPRSTLTLSD